MQANAVKYNSPQTRGQATWLSAIVTCMTLTLEVFLGLSLIELLLWLPLFKAARRWMVVGLIPLLSVVSGLQFGAQYAVWAFIVLVLSGYRIVNLLRLLEERTTPARLNVVARRSSLWLIGLQLTVVVVALVGRHFGVTKLDWWYAFGFAQLFTAIVIFSSTRRHLQTTRAPQITKHLADRDLPTLSVCVPARNETEDLEACLESLVASNYSKLEILVLDDCSQNKHTPEIIRGYAQHGVHFIGGKVPPERWLAKNYAYEQLTQAANGDILLFCGVDTRFTPDSLRHMIETMLAKNKTMLSLVPRNDLPLSGQRLGLLVQPARYAWELSLPRRLLERPPVLSTCWLIERSALMDAGGFEAVSHTVVPESYFARFTASHADGYGFLQADSALGLDSAKSYVEQRATAIRTRYPQTHRRPEIVALLSLAEVTLLSLPLVTALTAALSSHWPLLALSAFTMVLLADAFSRVTTLTYRHFLSSSLFIWPFTVLFDVGLLNYSMWRYEFREVVWKDRNICIPLMRVASGLPKT